jgi:hypothetical protein
VKRKFGYTMSRDKGWCRDNGWIFMVTHTVTDKRMRRTTYTGRP